ncbi:hypothetical protein YC2023_038158 [Brassica napus]
MVVGYTVSQKEKAQHKCQEMHQTNILDGSHPHNQITSIELHFFPELEFSVDDNCVGDGRDGVGMGFPETHRFVPTSGKLDFDTVNDASTGKASDIRLMLNSDGAARNSKTKSGFCNYIDSQARWKPSKKSLI